MLSMHSNVQMLVGPAHSIEEEAEVGSSIGVTGVEIAGTAIGSQAASMACI